MDTPEGQRFFFDEKLHYTYGMSLAQIANSVKIAGAKGVA